MSIELEAGLPSVRLLQTYLRDKSTVEVKLVTGDTITGNIAWQDPLCLCINADGNSVLIWRSALAFVKPV
ncbi:MAG: RNA-binding protein hfq [Cyanobacteria bacterium P01_F01_bin.86]